MASLGITKRSHVVTNLFVLMRFASAETNEFVTTKGYSDRLLQQPTDDYSFQRGDLIASDAIPIIGWVSSGFDWRIYDNHQG